MTLTISHTCVTSSSSDHEKQGKDGNGENDLANVKQATIHADASVTVDRLGSGVRNQHLDQTAALKSDLENSFPPVIYDAAGSQCTLFNSV